MPAIELLTRPGCVQTRIVGERLGDALARLHGSLTHAVVDLSRLPETDRRRRYPTPTVLVDGRDLFGLPEPPGGQAPT
jgi:hypothetical protein